MSKSQTATNPEWLHNSHAGELLVSASRVISICRKAFFLGLQLDHELLEVKRALNGELDRIIPRAA